MEELNTQESFEDVKNRITEIFNREGLSENLNSEIEVWHSRKQQETDLPDGTIEQRVKFQVELAQIYIVTRRYDLASDTLDDALYQADQEGLTDIAEEIKVLIRNLP